MARSGQLRAADAGLRKSLICIRPVDRFAGRGLDGNTRAPGLISGQVAKDELGGDHLLIADRRLIRILAPAPSTRLLGLGLRGSVE
jgi:hypothetical protein